MKSHLQWKQGFQSTVDNGRSHEVTLDLPPAKNGSDTGPTALELTAMSLNGCIGTIFAVIASKSHLEFTDLRVELEADKSDSDPTFTAVTAHVHVTTDAKEQKVQRVLDKTMDNCPVGVLFRNADVEMKINLKVHHPEEMAM